MRDVRLYLNHLVKITGEVRPLVPGSEDLVIVARTLKLIGNNQTLPFTNNPH